MASRELCSTVRELRLQRRDGLPFVQRAGQYIVLRPGEVGPDGESRPYSISSPPNDVGELCVCVQHTDSPFAARIAALEVGSEILAEDPSGRFILPDELDDDLLLVATGTGISPFRAMAARLVAHAARRSVVLLFGARRAEGLLYDEDWRELAEEVEGFTYMPTLSAPHEGEWGGAVGRVQATLPAALEGLRLDATRAYLCGFPQMLEEMRTLLADAGLAPEKIISKQ